MTRLTDTQLVLLSAAAGRADGIIPLAERLKGGAARTVATRLLTLGLAEEQAALPNQSWRENEACQRVALVITAKGLAAIGIVEGDEPDHPADAVNDGSAAAPASATAGAPASACHRQLCTKAGPRAGTKKAQVISLLQQADGASLDEIIALTDWLPHTTRAALTGLRKSGLTVVMARQAGSATRYRIVAKMNDMEV